MSRLYESENSATSSKLVIAQTKSANCDRVINQPCRRFSWQIFCISNCVGIRHKVPGGINLCPEAAKGQPVTVRLNNSNMLRNDYPRRLILHLNCICFRVLGIFIRMQYRFCWCSNNSRTVKARPFAWLWFPLLITLGGCTRRSC